MPEDSRNIAIVKAANVQSLREECERATRDFVCIAGWRCELYRVENAVADVLSDPRAAFASMKWLLEQTYGMPFQQNAATRLNQFVRAVTLLREAEQRAKR